MLKFGFPATGFPDDIVKAKDINDTALMRYCRLLGGFLEQLIQQRRAIMQSSNARDIFLIFCAPFREADLQLQHSQLSALACPYHVLKESLFSE